MSTFEAVVVSVGAVPPLQCTVAGHVTVREPVASCATSRIRTAAPFEGAVNVYVQLPVSVDLRTFAVDQSIVCAVELFPLSVRVVTAACTKAVEAPLVELSA